MESHFLRICNPPGTDVSLHLCPSDSVNGCSYLIIIEQGASESTFSESVGRIPSGIEELTKKHRDSAIFKASASLFVAPLCIAGS